MKILHLSHCGPIKAATGGIIHVKESIRLEREAGHESFWISVRPYAEPGLIKGRTHLRLNSGSITPENVFGDWFLSQEVSDSIKARKFLHDFLLSNKPDIIVLEGPWMWPILKRVVAENNLVPNWKIVYSVHNLESELLPTIYASRGWSEIRCSFAKSLLESVEIELIRKADLCVALNDTEGISIRGLGAKEVVIASNGVTLQKSTPFTRYLVNRVIPRSQKVGLFVSSNWDPHVEGLRDFLVSLEKFKATNKSGVLIIVGSIHDSFPQEKAISFSITSKYQNQRVIFTGKINSSLLGALIERANFFFLPIAYGGGKGIKTSEALMSGKAVIGTPAAFRGFPSSIFCESVIETSSYEHFATQCVKWLNPEHEVVSRSSDHSELSWDVALKPWISWLGDHI